jgi:hypothetical protein
VSEVFRLGFELNKQQLKSELDSANTEISKNVDASAEETKAKSNELTSSMAKTLSSFGDSVKTGFDKSSKEISNSLTKNYKEFDKHIRSSKNLNDVFKETEQSAAQSSQSQVNSLKEIERQLRELNRASVENNELQDQQWAFNQANQVNLSSQINHTIGQFLKFSSVVGTVMLITKARILDANNAVLKLFTTFADSDRLNWFFGVEMATRVKNVIRSIATEFHWVIKFMVALKSATDSIFVELTKSVSSVFALEHTFKNASHAMRLVSMLTGGMGAGISEMLQKLSILGAALATLFSYIISKAILTASGALVELGKSITKVAVEATTEFSKFDQQAKILESTISAFNKTFGDVGNVERYKELISELSLKFNLSNIELQKASSELISVGSKIGLNKDQIEDLIVSTAEFAKIYHKDVFEASVSFGQALQGSSQSVQAYGVKLGEASNQHFLLKKGIEGSFGKLTENQQVQVRFNNLMEQYAIVTGIGAVAANSMADANARNAILTENLSRKFGSGAAMVEGWNVQGFLLNKILDNLNPSLIEFAGFMTAIAGRTTTAIGTIVDLSFKFYILRTVIALVNVALKSEAWELFATKKLPVVGVSLDNITSKFIQSEVKIRSLMDILKLLGNKFKLVFQQASKLSNITIIIDAIKFKMYEWLISFQIVMSRAAIALRPVMIQLSLLLIPFIKIIAIIALAYASFKLLKAALSTIEEQTGALSAIWEIMLDTFKNTANILQPVINFFKDSMGGINDFFQMVFSKFVFYVTWFTSKIVSVLKINPFGVFSSEAVKKLDDIERKLIAFDNKIIASGFNISKFAKESAKDVNSLADAFKEINIEDIESLEDQLKNAGKSQLQILEDTKLEQTRLLDEAYRQDLISLKRLVSDSYLVYQKFNSDKAEEIKKLRGPLDQMTKSIANAGLNNIEVLENEKRESLRILDETNAKGLVKVQEYQRIKNMIELKYQSGLAQEQDKIREKLAGVLVELQNHGMNAIIQLEKQTNARSNIINASYQQGLIEQESFNNLKLANDLSYNEKLEEIKQSEAYIVESLKDSYKISLKDAQKYYSVAKDMADSFEKIVVAGIETAGAALVNGQGAWSNFTAFVLDTIGTLMINVGVAGLGISQAIAALAASIAALNPFAAAAASVALIAAGGALKALASGMKGQSSSPSGTSTSTLPQNAGGGGSEGNINVLPRPERERTEPGQNFVINIEGNYYHAEETAKNLIEIINKEFDKKGTKFRRGAFA